MDMAARYGAFKLESNTRARLKMPSAELYATVGCHPTSTSEIAKRANVEEYFNDLESVIKDEVKKGEQSRIVAIGEIGLGKALSLPLGPCTHVASRL